MAAKALEACQQPHGFLSLTYTQAVTCNVLHKLTARQETAGPQRLNSAGFDGSPQHLHEILLTAQPFDLVFSCPLLASITQVFHTVTPPPSRWAVKEYRSAGQPMRGCAFSSSSLPLIYVTTSVIRVFCPLQDSSELWINSFNSNTSTRLFMKYLIRHQLNVIDDLICGYADFHMKEKKEDTLVLKIGSVSVAPQADNPLTRTILRKDIYQWVHSIHATLQGHLSASATYTPYSLVSPHYCIFIWLVHLPAAWLIAETQIYNNLQCKKYKKKTFITVKKQTQHAVSQHL